MKDSEPDDWKILLEFWLIAAIMGAGIIGLAIQALR
jgi:hypothetical protein